MLRWVRVAASAALLLGLDASASNSSPVAAAGPAARSDAQSAAASTSASGASASPQATPEVLSDRPLRGQSRLDIMRAVDGEYARVMTPLPAGKKGFHIKVGQALDTTTLNKSIFANGTGVNAGDKVQITRLVFLPRGILVDLNGGGHQRTSFKDHLQLQVGLPGSVSTTPNTPPPENAHQVGATLYLDFNRALPDMNAVQLKQLLAVALDFSKQRSAALQYIDTLPPKFQDAIRDKRAAIGMDRDQVLAALGRPDNKIRDRDPDGKETEDWIYGTPPTPIEFVRFKGDAVVQIHQYPHPIEDSPTESTAQR